jgi:1,4-alpha-glucan branching enzyme
MKRKVKKKVSRKKTAVKKTVVKKTVSKSTKVMAQKGIKKQYLKTSPECRVTFRLPGEAAPGSHTVTIVGDFNNWSADDMPMKKLKSGDFQIVLKLPSNREYRFRYLFEKAPVEFITTVCSELQKKNSAHKYAYIILVLFNQLVIS